MALNQLLTAAKLVTTRALLMGIGKLPKQVIFRLAKVSRVSTCQQQQII